MVLNTYMYIIHCISFITYIIMMVFITYIYLYISVDDRRLDPNSSQIADINIILSYLFDIFSQRAKRLERLI